MIETLPNWAKSASGREIGLFRSRKSGTGGQRPILIIGGVHGDEPEGVWLARHVLEWLKSFKTDLEWIVIPCINPDGFEAQRRTNGNGVDLNRNFPCPNWSPDYTKDRYYPGPNPGSEPEVRALIGLINDSKPQLIIHCHSWKPMIVYTGDPAKRDSDRLAKSSGYISNPEIGYPTPGSLGEYGWKQCGIPVICIEELDGEPKENIWPHFKVGFEDIFSDTSPRIK